MYINKNIKNPISSVTHSLLINSISFKNKNMHKREPRDFILDSHEDNK